MKLIIINGPNLNLLGNRENGIYGSKSFDDFFVEMQFKYRDIELQFYQSNIEGNLIDKIQEAASEFKGIILNAAAYTHTSVGIGDAVRAIDIPVVEVHISNTFAREEFRHTSHIAPYTKGVITGFGLQSYELAIQSFLNVK
ncbi:type II 3-dehydroquinate dehydratase [Planktosalinus lacus]|uniref:3-dehydroquinate dehydratase n=1 Tax=Planktosalinus lacus TaxID=1526573 RepID=A0A8J2Y8C6_9FLAO|nr:type II 3-dehydroquinate dehydratase [Planktosalinus lacus]GGD92231.1 3-dehydroquinate dehydratase [Planktosalinus lacus]